MGSRRDDIPVVDRMQMGIAVLSSQREWGAITQFAQKYHLSRQSVYAIGTQVQRVLLNNLQPGPHGPHPAETVIQIDRNRLLRSTLVLTDVGVSQRDIEFVLDELLDTPVSASWVNHQLAALEKRAAQVNAGWHPTIGEGLAGDELFTAHQPNLLVVGNDSLFIYALNQQPTRDGDTWGCVLLDMPPTPQFASDGGTGLAAGVAAAGMPVHQLDWDHLLRALWHYDVQLERQAYAALQALDERTRLFEQAHTEKRLTHHWQQWEHLHHQAAEAMTRYDRFHVLACEVDAEFAMIDLVTGSLRDSQSSAAHLQTVGQRMQTLVGRTCNVLGTSLTHWADGLVSYLPRLAQTLAPLVETWGAPAVHALSRLWQVEAEIRRGHLSFNQRQALEQIWRDSLDQAASHLGDRLFEVWETLAAILGRIWRGSMAAECVNSLLRPRINTRKHTDQGELDLFRFLHNTHHFARGKRAKHSPAELVGIKVPTDRFTLLGLAPKVSI
jgi:hypothetical protein